MTTRRTTKIAALVASLTLAGCGGSVLKTPAEEPLPASTDGTLAVLDRAEADLRLALGEPAPPAYASPPPAVDHDGAPAQPSASASPMAGAPAPAPGPPPPPADAPAGKGAERVHSDASVTGAADMGGLGQNSPCISACRALASMARAADHLCGLTGSEDTLCEGARTRVKNAGDRVRSQCPACS